MSFNTFGKVFRFTTWGESHGPAIGCIIDGCPPLINLNERDIQIELNKRKPGQSKFTTQRKESDKVEILSGVFEGKTTGKDKKKGKATLISLLGDKNTIKYANKLILKINTKLKKYGPKSKNLTETLNFILNRNK